MRSASRYLAVLVLLVVFHAVAFAGESRAPVSLTYLRCEYEVDPLGIDVRQPRLSWQPTADGCGVVQVAYQVRVVDGGPGLAAGSIWDTGRVDSDQSIQVIHRGRRSRPGGVITRSSGSGTVTGRSQTGAYRHFGRWACSTRRIGRHRGAVVLSHLARVTTARKASGWQGSDPHCCCSLNCSR